MTLRENTPQVSDPEDTHVPRDVHNIFFMIRATYFQKTLRTRSKEVFALGTQGERDS